MSPLPRTIDFIELPAVGEAGVGAAKRFYGEAFGWSFQDWGDDYADTASSGVGCGLNADPAHRPRMPLVVLYATDLERARSSVLAAGGTITREIFSFPGGRRFHFEDPGGNELAVWSESGPDGGDGPPAVPPVARAALLTAAIEGSKAVDRVEVQRIEMAPGLASGLHLHPCPVVGVVTRGSVLFQVEGEPARVLKPGDAFHEPANARVPHFDAQEEGASFVAFYLLGAGETELLRMLE